METMTPDMTMAQLRLSLRKNLTPKYGEREAAEMARMVLMHLKGWSLPELMANEQRTAGDFIASSCCDILNRLLTDEPIQYVLGVADFYGLKLSVRPGVLIPRPETEELVDLIVKENKSSDLKVLDLCTGSGAIAIALARNLPFSSVTAVDISPEAVAVAEENASKLKTRIKIEKADVLKMSLPSDSFDIIVSNPPYVCESEKAGMEPNVIDHEPHLALFVPDASPLLFYKAIAEQAVEALTANGRLYFEINPLHAAELKQLLSSLNLRDVEIIKDIHGKDRFAKATAPAR